MSQSPAQKSCESDTSRPRKQGDRRNSVRVSVCIPAYNEEATIGSLVQQIVTSQDKRIEEVLVCANGCTDRTEAIVLESACRDQRIKLLRSQPGKPTAWNTLIAAAENDYVVFLDGDIKLNEGAIASLVDRLEEQKHIVCASGINVPEKLLDFSLSGEVSRLASRPLIFDYVYGGLYAISRTRLFRRLDDLGFRQPYMPEDLIADDYWIELVAGPFFVVERNAVAFFNPGTIEDVLRARARLEVSRRQIHDPSFQPVVFGHASRKPLTRKLAEKLLAPAPLREKVHGLAGTCTRLLLLGFYRKNIRQLKTRMLDDVAARRGASVLSQTGRISTKNRK